MTRWTPLSSPTHERRRTRSPRANQLPGPHRSRVGVRTQIGTDNITPDRNTDSPYLVFSGGVFEKS